MKIILAWIVVISTILFLFWSVPHFGTGVLIVLGIILLIWAIVTLVIKYIPEDLW